MACLIILHNWFPITYRNLVVATWVCSAQLIVIIRAIWFPDYKPDHDNYILESLLMSLAYLVLSIVCYFYFQHHPSHVGVVVHKRASSDNGFFLEELI